MKKFIFFYLFVVLFVFASFLQAGTKEELQALKQDILTLQDQFRVFEETLNEYNTGLAGIKSLVEQLNDQVAKSSISVDKVASAMEQKNSGDRAQEEEILRLLQSLSNKTDEMATHIAALARQVSELEVQSAPMNRSASSDISSADVLYNQAYYDFMDEDYDLAISGFNEYLIQFPTGNKAADALINIGYAYFYKGQFQQAAETFTKVIDENADSAKVATALFKRGEAFLEIQDSDKAVADFKEVIKRFPDASEAALAKNRLQDLGVNN